MTTLLDGLKATFEHAHLCFDRGQFLVVGALGKGRKGGANEEDSAQEKSVPFGQVISRDFQATERRHTFPFLKSVQGIPSVT
ncbi:hypothetical protein GCM10007872_30770 [Gluconobacter sphaericus NBRC 12467]|uniref:Uncharacterized protein n=1 Tax=Gluconobacter sphaericus NBRC 12467 TaxID=1307951 RepID=A0AA37WCR6_9PROT|nr:hypothetical protein AA12467_0757 [Gluconobacter sphaericus NBRC 12467]GEB43254.1 hypothetical protein GSP01_20360 [Gluconobacter sphaericus NBRC 12467]GLQ86166.1 hypothetical protein GCM10007872_30770 [Gluconobacter sphaericus NBRC 12467]